MRVVLDPGTFDCSNLGDLAMLQVGVARVRDTWPGAEVHVFTRNAAALAVHCPDVQPMSDQARRAWLADRFFLGGLHRALPRSASRRLVAARNGVHERWPTLVERAMLLKMRLRPTARGEVSAFRATVLGADLVALAGQHGLADWFRSHARIVLDTLDMASRRGIPIALFGQAVGPLEDPELRARVRRVLPRAVLITLRERCTSVPALESLGIPPARMMVTGDEAVSLAYDARREALGDALGVSLRTTPVAGVRDDAIGRVREPVQAFARAHGVALVPLASAHHDVARDGRTLRALLRGYDDDSDGGAHLDTTPKVLVEVARCRVVVAGAYHVAVFALAQGIPTVCLTESAYYTHKFVGLADLFGDGCQIVSLRSPALRDELAAAIERAWECAPSVREPLRAAAARQAELSRAAYRRVREALDSGRRV